MMDGEEKDGRLRMRDFFPFVRGAMARALVGNGATMN